MQTSHTVQTTNAKPRTNRGASIRSFARNVLGFLFGALLAVGIIVGMTVR